MTAPIPRDAAARRLVEATNRLVEQHQEQPNIDGALDPAILGAHTTADALAALLPEEHKP